MHVGAFDLGLPQTSSGSCRWCGESIRADARSDSRYCGKVHRQQAWRFFRQIGRCELPAGAPLRLAFADPPYPGLAGYYVGHPAYAGEVDHGALLAVLDAGFDGWAYATSKAGMVQAIRELDKRGITGWDVATWARGPRVRRAMRPTQSTEFVIYKTARASVVVPQVPDCLVHVHQARTGDPRHIIGAKPAAYIRWMFGLLGARANDSFADLYPGSGRVMDGWTFWTGATPD